MSQLKTADTVASMPAATAKVARGPPAVKIKSVGPITTKRFPAKRSVTAIPAATHSTGISKFVKASNSRTATSKSARSTPSTTTAMTTLATKISAITTPTASAVKTLVTKKLPTATPAATQSAEIRTQTAGGAKSAGARKFPNAISASTRSITTKVAAKTTNSLGNKQSATTTSAATQPPGIKKSTRASNYLTATSTSVRSAATIAAATLATKKSPTTTPSPTQSARTTQSAGSAKSARAPKSLSTTSAHTRSTITKTKSRSPFSSFITTGLRVRNRCLAQSSDFAYDLSREELRFMGNFKSPMKAVPEDERELLKSGQRGAYLAMRYEHSPNRKYNFPEATSWRIGWLHNQQRKQAASST